MVIASFIVRAFPDLASAMARTEHGWPEALSCNDVPGAGGEVYGALEFLKRCREDWDAAVADANDHWQSTTSNGYRDCYDLGMRQANGISSRLRKAVEKWPEGVAKP
jgi:hypothetical protein